MEECKSIDNSQPQDKETRENINSRCALDLLINGNKRFQKNVSLNRNLQEQRKTTSSGQYPFAAVLSCMDSRASSEIVFDQAIGDIFNIRIVGNFVSNTMNKPLESNADCNCDDHNILENNDVLGGIEFASIVINVPLILVLGHTNCGAVDAAIQENKKKSNKEKMIIEEGSNNCELPKK